MAINCPLCYSAKVNEIFNKRGLLFFKCSDCNFVFLCNTDNPNFLNTLADFEPAYYNYFKSNRADRKNHHSLLNWIQKYKTSKDIQLLDIGCGSGKWVNYLNQHGFTAWGIEPSVALYNHFLIPDNSFECTTVSNYILNTPGKIFDIITAFDVLEHTKDPVEFLTGITTLMHSETLLFISTPDMGSFHRKTFGKYWHYFNKYHYSYFSKKTLQLAASKAGLILLNTSHKSRYFQTSYVWEYFKNFVLQKKSAYSPPKNELLVSLNFFDNIYCVLKKNDKQVN